MDKWTKKDMETKTYTGREILRMKWKQQASNTIFGRGQQPKTKLDGEKWFVAYAQQGATRLKEEEKLTITGYYFR